MSYAVELLRAGQYLGPPVWQRAHAGLDVSLCRYRAALNHSWHVHANPTIFILLSGSHCDRSRHADHCQRPLTGVFHPVTEPHATVVGAEGMVGLNIELTRRWLSEHCLAASQLGGYSLLDSATQRLALLRLLVAAATNSAPADLETACIELIEPQVADRQLYTPGRAPKWLVHVDNYIRHHYRLPIGLRDVAREVKVHPVYLARVYRLTRGQTVGEQVRAWRVAEAARLVHEGYPLAEAACRAGFADQSHFTRLCRRNLGFTPKQLSRISELV